MQEKSNILDNIRKRIIYIADNHHVSRNEFMLKTGIKKGLFDKKDINRAVGSDKISNILDSDSNISPEWLLTGKGEMLSIGGKLKDFRIRQGLSIESFAKLIREDFLLVEDVEKGDIEPTHSYVVKIKETFDWSDDNLNTSANINEPAATYIKPDSDQIRKMEAIIEDLEKIIKELKEKLIESQQDVISLLKNQRPSK